MVLVRNIWNIFKTDIKNISTNWVAAIVIGGLIFLPSLYAWLNIKASWDPYGQTEQIPVALVNEDKGTEVRDEEFNVGKELVDELKEDDSLDWKFVDRKTAMNHVEYGDYFAVVVIPENFSEQLATVTSKEPKKAKVEYYVNEKINAIAPKITQKGASVIVDEISSNFISTVNGVIFEVFNEIGIELEKEIPDIERFQDYVFTLEENLPEMYDLLSESLEDADSASNIIADAQDLIPEVEDLTDSGLETIDETIELLNEAETYVDEMGPKIKEELNKVQEMADKANDFLETIDSADLNMEEGTTIVDELDEGIDVALEKIEAMEEALEALKDIEPIEVPQPDDHTDEKDGEDESKSTDEDENTDEAEDKAKEIPDVENIVIELDHEEEIDEALEELERLKNSIEDIRTQAEEVRSFIDEKKSDVESGFADLKELTSNTSTKIDDFVEEYNETIEPAVTEKITDTKGQLNDAREILVDIQSTIPEVERILNNTDSNLDDGKEYIEYALGEYPYINDKVNELADNIRDLQDEADLQEIVDLLKNDPDKERGFFAEPVVLHENKLFPIENYGTGMTPFYTSLAIWVGGLLLISLVSTEVQNPENFTGRQMYFGRLFTFLTFGFLQTLIATLGDIFIIGVDMSAPVLFVVFGLLISAVFITIIYTLTSVFGDVGKAGAIILLVLQIAGSGGTYPVVLLPEFFQMVNPLLPFTYAVDLMRETVGGIVWPRAIRDIIFLSLFGFVTIIFGAFLKGPLKKHTDKLMKKSKESGMFH